MRQNKWLSLISLGLRPPPRGKRDGVNIHISKRENRNWMEKLRYCVIDQSGIQLDPVNLA